MCLIVQVGTFEKAQELFDNPLVMKKDKIVYKVLVEKDWGYGAKTYKSPFRHYAWEKGQHYYERGKKLGVNGLGARWGGRYGFDVDQGLHAYTTPKVAYKHVSAYCPDYVVVEMVIPAGAKYYMDRSGEIVATEMIFYDDAVILGQKEFAKKHNLKIK